MLLLTNTAQTIPAVAGAGRLSPVGRQVIHPELAAAWGVPEGTLYTVSMLRNKMPPEKILREQLRDLITTRAGTFAEFPDKLAMLEAWAKDDFIAGTALRR